MQPVKPLSALVAFVLVAGMVAACGGGDTEDSPTATPTEGSQPTGTAGASITPVGPLSDREYLAVICSGLEDYTAAIIRERTEEGIRTVVLDYIASLQGVLPPADLGEFHQSFIAYLTAAIESPTDLLATPRPLPPDDVRDRLAAIENDVPECRSAKFFGEREEDG